MSYSTINILSSTNCETNPVIYENFHIYQYTLFLLQLQQLDIDDFLYHFSLVISDIESHTLIKHIFKSYWYTFFELWFNIHIFHVSGLILLRNLYECFKFSEGVTISRFTNLLSSLIQFLWFTCSSLFNFLINDSITIRWILMVFLSNLSYLCKDICLYHFLWVEIQSIICLLYLSDLTLPKLLTS